MAEVFNKLNYFHDLPPGPNPPEEIYAFVEIPRGGTNKYEYKKELGTLMLDRVLYESVFYPTEYGFVPQTWISAEKDPLDIMVITTNPTFPGCLLKVRPVGMIKISDSGQPDNKIVAVATQDPRLSHIQTVNDYNPHFRVEVESFWENYSRLQTDKEIKILGWGDLAEAKKYLDQAIVAYQEEFGG